MGAADEADWKWSRGESNPCAETLAMKASTRVFSCSISDALSVADHFRESQTGKVSQETACQGSLAIPMFMDTHAIGRHVVSMQPN